MGRGKATHHLPGQPRPASPARAVKDTPAPPPLWERASEDERVEYLSRALAYEARVIEAHLAGRSRIPKGLGFAARGAVDRLRRAALGEAEQVYLHGVISSRASSALNQVLAADPDVAPLVRFSDRENSLRLALAGEAAELEQALEYAGFPAGRRRIAAEQIDRMRAAAAGHYEQAYAATNTRSFEGALASLRAGA